MYEVRAVYVSIWLATIVGCSRAAKELPPRQHVKGSVRYNGIPLEGATVTFWRTPLNTRDWRAVRPIAIVRADGSFEPNSYGDGDGAVKGEYALTLVYRASRATPDLFGGRYTDPANPIWVATVTEGENILPPIELKGPPLALPRSGSDSGL